MLILWLACDRGEDSEASVPPLLAEASIECVPLEQPGSNGTTVPSGYESCTVDGEGSFVHRVKAIDAAIDPTVEEDAWCGSPKAPGDCAGNADCAPGYACESDPFGHCECIQKCRTDAECGPGYACMTILASLTGTHECVRAECLTDADCPSNWCVVSESTCGASIPGMLHCFGPHDECLTPADCEADPLCHVVDGAFRCDGQSDCM